MIVRDARRRVLDMGPLPGGTDGLESATAMALRAEVFVSPIERRYLTPVELAAVREDEPEPPSANRIRTTARSIRESALRGAAATARRYAA